jgi:polar amino acid transport system permease protein
MNLIGLLAWGDAGWGDELAWGALVTITLALATLPVGIVAGFFLALGKQSRDPLVRASAHAYTTVFRGIPDLLTLFVVYYGSQSLLDMVTNSLFGVSLNFNPFVAGMIALGIVLASYTSEVFLSAFRSIPHGQYEAADAVGLRHWQKLRLVILPQVIRLALPGLSNLWLGLMKDTALVSVITLNDLLRETQIAVSFTKQPFFFYAVACLIYLAFSLISSVGIHRIDAWSVRGARR